MNATYIKGDTVNVTLTDDTVLTGEFVSVDAKGTVSIKVDGKLVTRAASRVASIDVPSEDEVEGYTSAALAEMFDTSARALRRRLRDLGMGVGKGRRYNLTDDALATVRASIEGTPIED